MKRRWWIAIGALVLLSALVLLRGGGGNSALAVEVGSATRQDAFRSYVSASGEVVAERFADIGSSAMGRVVQLPVTEGDRVEQGALLALIDPVQARSELEAAEAAIEALQAEAKAARDQVEAARAELQLAEAREREASASFERSRSLFNQELLAPSDLDAAQAAADSASAQVSAAKAAVSRGEGALTAAEQRITQARAQANRSRDQLQKTSIASPIDGVVSRLQVREGEMVVIGIQNQPGTVLMTISDLSELNAEVKVAEADVLRVTVGQRAEVSLEALPGQTFGGVVTEVGASALPQLGQGAAAREFRVEIRLDEPAPGMRPGLTCDAEILVGEKSGVVTVPLQAVVIRSRPDSSEEATGVFVVEDGSARFREVTSGIIGGLDIEVTGLDEGTNVVVGPYDVLRELADGDAVRSR